MLKRISIPHLLFFVLCASAYSAAAQQLTTMHAEMVRITPVQLTPSFVNLPNKMAYITTNASSPQPVDYTSSSNANPAQQQVTPNLNMAVRSVAAGAGILGLIAGGRLSNKWAINPKLKIYGGVGWGSNMCNVGIIF